MMKSVRMLWRFVVVLGGWLLALRLVAQVAPVPGVAFRSDHILIKPRAGATTSLLTLHQDQGARVGRAARYLGGIQLIQVPPGGDPQTLVARYRASGLVECAEPDYLIRAADSPGDPDFANGTQWALDNAGLAGGTPGTDIRAFAAWDAISSASNIVVAIVDSGIRLTHEDLAANLWTNPGELAGNGRDDDGDGVVDDVHGLNAIDNSGNVEDENGHGTHIAGIIGGVGGNGRGIAGVAWQVQLMPCKFLDRFGSGSTADAIQCINYARTHGAQIINASWGGSEASALLRDAIDQARAAGIMFVTAAGNSATNLDSQPTYPAGFGLDNVITVAATTRTDQLAAFSNFGAHTVDLAAPGVDIFSTYYTADNGYATLSGTSMAAPLVSGAFALLRARYPAETYHQLINRLLSTTDELLSLAGKCVTGGRLNLARALGPTFLVNFAPSVGAGFAPLNVTFTNTTAGKATRWDWDFGDGTAHDTNQNPAHRFTQVGKFSVTLTAANDRATNVFSRALAVERAGVISAYTTIGAGQFELHFVGQAAQAYAVLASTNLSDWTPVGTNVAAADGTFLFLDQFAGNFSRRFYRTVELPPAP